MPTSDAELIKEVGDNVSELEKAERHFIKMDSRTDWAELQSAAATRHGRQFGIHAPEFPSSVEVDWGITLDWVRRKNIPIAQIFLTSARAYMPCKRGDAELRSEVTRSVFKNSGVDLVVHSPYVIQIAGLMKTRKVSAKALKTQCIHAQNLGIKRVVIHASSPKVLSTHPDDSEMEVMNCWKEVLLAVNRETPDVSVLIENPAWKNTWFSDPIKLADTIRKLRDTGIKVGMCYDSAHHWAAVPKDKYLSTDLKQIADVVGLIHYNDCPAEPCSGLDRHSYTPMGTGKIPKENLKAVLDATPGTPVILERASYYDVDLEFIAAL